MSMNTYAMHEFGFVLSSDEAKAYIRQQLLADGGKADEDEVKTALDNSDFAKYTNAEDVFAHHINADGGIDWWDEVNSTTEYVLPINWPSLFKGAYRSMDDLIREVKEGDGKFLPPDFPYAERLAFITGVEFS